jgi:hypothetical protein
MIIAKERVRGSERASTARHVACRKRRRSHEAYDER